MSTEKLTMVTLSGPMGMVDYALQHCVLGREFHMENAIESMRGVKKLYPYDSPNPYVELLQKAYDIMDLAKIKPEFSEFEDKGFTPESTSKFFDGLYSKVSALRGEYEEAVRRIAEIEAIHSQIKHLESVDERMRDLFDLKYVEFRFGRVPNENYDECFEIANSRIDAYFIRTGEDGEWTYGIYFALPSTVDQVDAIFGSRGFERIRISGSVNLSWTAEQMSQSLAADEEAARASLKDIELLIYKEKTFNAEEFLSRYSYVRFISEAWDLRPCAGYRHDKFYIVGWIPEADALAYAAECAEIEGLGCILASPKDTGQTPPPVKSKSGFLYRIFTPFLEMYGLPSYSEIDPTLFMSITYIIIFGIMFGDVGQGVVLILAGILLWKKRSMWMGRVVACVGVSAVVFGFVYGSIFGFEHVLPGFKVMEDGNALKILMVSVAIGAVLILICMVMNMVNCARQHDRGKLLFSPNGLAGIVFYGGVCAGALSVVLGHSILSAPYIIIVILIPLFCIFASEPLSKLVSGKKNWLPHSIGGFIVEGFFELFETVLSYVSNTVSFLRIGAFAISHAGMMSVVFLLTGDGSNIPGLIVGNLIVMGIEAVLVCIQVMRLEFYELFGRFYTSGGKRFSPKIVSYETIPQK